MLVQLPLLAVAGWFLGRAIETRFRMTLQIWNKYGASGLIAAIACFIFWMLPRSLDASLNEPLLALMKYLTIPLFFGASLGASWRRAPAWLRGFLIVNFLSMLVFLAWLYASSPEQLCNNYTQDEQRNLASSLIRILIIVSVFFAAKPLFGRTQCGGFNLVSEPRCTKQAGVPK